MERIDLPALKCKDGMILTGKNHSRIYVRFKEITGECPEIVERGDGFVTTDHRFVDRKEAYEIAVLAGQLRYPEIQHSVEILSSEDLYLDPGEYWRGGGGIMKKTTIF